ncbi:hypothetical protein BGW42_000195 [Actinomortierella wolfii]|nr:hypothetical protein BGW42_000195 [Actinomortierella wolfii]
MAQFGISKGCSNCLEQRLLTSVPQCATLNLTNSSQYNTPEYRDCICYSSFDFNWTLPCRDYGSCQVTELSDYREMYSAVFAQYNLTCIKPTPTPLSSASKTGLSFGVQMAAAASAVIMTMLVGGIGAFLAIVGF